MQNTDWYIAESGDIENKPSELDTTSSKRYNYVRKDFERVEPVWDGDECISPAHWTWMEKKVLKSDWETFTKVMVHDGTLEEVQDALIELAEMIVEVE